MKMKLTETANRIKIDEKGFIVGISGSTTPRELKTGLKRKASAVHFFDEFGIRRI
jgi:hypothetical protein